MTLNAIRIRPTIADYVFCRAGCWLTVEDIARGLGSEDMPGVRIWIREALRSLVSEGCVTLENWGGPNLYTQEVKA